MKGFSSGIEYHGNRESWTANAAPQEPVAQQPAGRAYLLKFCPPTPPSPVAPKLTHGESRYWSNTWKRLPGIIGTMSPPRTRAKCPGGDLIRHNLVL